MAREGDDLPGAGVHGNDGAGPGAEGLFSGLLNVQVDGEVDVRSRFGVLDAEVLHLHAGSVHLDHPPAGHAAEKLVVGFFKPALSHQEPDGRLLLPALRLGDLADVPHLVRGEPAVGIVSAVLRLHDHAGQVLLVRLHHGHLFPGRFFLDLYRLVFGPYRGGIGQGRANGFFLHLDEG